MLNFGLKKHDLDLQIINLILLIRIQEVQYERRQYEDTVGQLTDRLEFNKEVAARANHELKVRRIISCSGKLVELRVFVNSSTAFISSGETLGCIIQTYPAGEES